MYVSSFNTYVQPNSSKESLKSKFDFSKKGSFENEIQKEIPAKERALKNLPVDYVAKNRNFSSKLELQAYNAELKKSTQEFTQRKTAQNAKVAYEENSKVSFLFQKADVTIGHAPTFDSTIREKNSRSLMVNTYLQNDRYYQITA